MTRPGIRGFLVPAVAVAVVLALIGDGRAQRTAPSSQGWAEITVPSDRPELTPEAIAEGKRIYSFRCSPCHGVKGDGEGPVAPLLDPKPRDFTFANYKFRTTAFSELTRDEDLYRTITRGIPGTAMPTWITLPPEERWQVIYYIKTFADDFFSDPLFDPFRVGDEGETYLLDAPEMPPASPELIEAGKAVFDRAGCKECHGEEARGDGPSSGKQFTYRKHRIVPRDLTKGWTFKAGTGVEDIWRTLTGGLNGTPMPSFIGQLDTLSAEQDENDRIAVAHYIRSLVVEEAASRETVLDVRKITGPLPVDPNDEAWESAHEIHFRLFGQVTRRPRWQIPSVDHVRVRAVYNDSSIAIRLEYDDRTRNLVHADPDILTEDANYPVIDVLDYEHNRVRFRDAVAVQFSVKPREWADRPYFLYGQIDDPVNLWRYRADVDSAATDTVGTFEEFTAKGPEKIALQPPDDQALGGAAHYLHGRWRVVMTRPLATAATRSDVQIEPGRFIPFSVMAWDGGAGESGLRQSLSSWYNMKLEAPIPKRAYWAGLFAFLLPATAELLLLRKARSRRV